MGPRLRRKSKELNPAVLRLEFPPMLLLFYSMSRERKILSTGTSFYNYIVRFMANLKVNNFSSQPFFPNSNGHHSHHLAVGKPPLKPRPLTWVDAVSPHTAFVDTTPSHLSSIAVVAVNLNDIAVNLNNPQPRVLNHYGGCTSTWLTLPHRLHDHGGTYWYDGFSPWWNGDHGIRGS